VVGGKSEDDVIKNVMTELVGPKLARFFNWQGKKAFKRLELSSVVFGKYVIQFFLRKASFELDCNKLCFEVTYLRAGARHRLVIEIGIKMIYSS
jgi:hypothetical protein